MCAKIDKTIDNKDCELSNKTVSFNLDIVVFQFDSVLKDIKAKNVFISTTKLQKKISKTSVSFNFSSYF